MDLNCITLPPGGFANQRSAIYFILIGGSYVYVGKTGTSNRTGRKSPLERLGSHLKKVGKTLSVFHDVRLPMAGEAVEFGYALPPLDLQTQRLERALVADLRGRLDDGRVLNRGSYRAPAEMAPAESSFVTEFAGAILSRLSHST